MQILEVNFISNEKQPEMRLKHTFFVYNSQISNKLENVFSLSKYHHEK